MIKKLLFILPLLFSLFCTAQNKLDVNARFNIDQKQIYVRQSIEYKPDSFQELDTIFLNDWSNSYSTKKTSLARRFAEEFSTKFHFAKSDERGFTTITSLKDKNGNQLDYSRLKRHPDVIRVIPKTPIQKGETYYLELEYLIQLPSTKFTGYGIGPNGEINLKYWYITPAVFDGEWHYYSNKDLDDLYIPKSDINLQIRFPKNYIYNSQLDFVTSTQFDGSQLVILNGKDRVDTRLFLSKSPSFKSIQTDNFTILSNLKEEDMSTAEKAIITDNVTSFINNNLGDYPFNTLMVTEIDAEKDPIYGLNQLPEFIRPFPKNFKYELTLLKNAIGVYLDNVLLLHPRKEQWLRDGIQIYYLIKYIEENFPEMKLLGALADVWGIRSFHAADLSFNEQYQLVYMHMARTNRDQALTTPKDKLLKFNQNLANKYKAGIGLKYLDDFINEDVLENTIQEFITSNSLKFVESDQFESLLKSKTEKDINWFFTDYINTRKKIDFKIEKVSKTEDSITLTIKNKRDNSMPVSLFTLNNDSVISKRWIENIEETKTITIPRDSSNKLVLNYQNTIPEYNLRDNWKSLKGFFFNHKPFQFRLFKDIEDPRYNQVFFMPMVEYNNIYDGLTLGMKLYNKTALRKAFNYRFTPQYALNSKSLTGSSSILYYINPQNKDLYNISLGFSGSYRSYAEDLFVRKITPYANFAFRDDDDLRSNKRHFVSLRYVDIRRDNDPSQTIQNDPNYSVFNARYVYSNDNLINFKRWFADLQFEKSFSKISFNYEYRKLFENNRQFNMRLFFGYFMHNNNPIGEDYFSFALDRPTDYLFDYNYLGRSEATGIFSQQLIIAEGGFKSKLQPAFANQWLGTANLSTSIWKYFQVYGDVGLVKNKNQKAEFVYDSGIRINLVADYFEVYFPVYSNLGWEIGQRNYDEKIRFLFTVDPQTLLGLFRRKWY